VRRKGRPFSFDSGLLSDVLPLETRAMLPRLLRLPQVLAATGLRRTAVLEAVKAGKFPQPVKILSEGRAQAWLEDEVAAFILERVRARDEAA
jgi:prophage regulatory protein